MRYLDVGLCTKYGSGDFITNASPICGSINKKCMAVYEIASRNIVLRLSCLCFHNILADHHVSYITQYFFASSNTTFITVVHSLRNLFHGTLFCIAEILAKRN